jgi:hypothetical protein
MRRYSSTKIVNRWDGKRVYNTTTYPDIVPSDSDLIVISNEGDYLDTLAYKYYSDPSLYWIIGLANNIGKGKMSVEPGLYLRIPTNVNDIINQFERLNN